MACFPPLPLVFLDESHPVKTRGTWLPYSENLIIQTSAVFD